MNQNSQGQDKPAADTPASAHGLEVSGQTPIPCLGRFLEGIRRTHAHRDYANVGLVDRVLAASCPAEG